MSFDSVLASRNSATLPVIREIINSFSRFQVPEGAMGTSFKLLPSGLEELPLNELTCVAVKHRGRHIVGGSICLVFLSSQVGILFDSYLHS